MEKIVIGKTDALVVVDPQTDFVDPDGKLFVAGVSGEEDNYFITGGIKRLLTAPFGHKAVTRDVHLKGHVEFAIFGEHCLDGTAGAMIYPALRQAIADNINFSPLDKGLDLSTISYSVATSRFYSAQLQELRRKGIKRIFLAGWAYTHCVGESAIAYACQGFETIVVRNLTRSVSPPYGNPEKMAEKLRLYEVKEITATDIA